MRQIVNLTAKLEGKRAEAALELSKLLEKRDKLAQFIKLMDDDDPDSIRVQQHGLQSVDQKITRYQEQDEKISSHKKILLTDICKQV